MHGKGVYSWKNGSIYHGNFENGHKNGNGTYKIMNGDSYIGEYKDD